MPKLNDAVKLVRVMRSEGMTGVAERLTRRASDRWGAPGEQLFLRPQDVADSSRIDPAPPGAARSRGKALSIGWIITAPGPASGGHTTIFRFVEALEEAGHECVLYIYDGQGGAAQQYESLIRTWWPGVRAQVRSVHDGIAGMDAYVATAWATAHVLAGQSSVPGKRFYLVQDFEPYFYPRGSAYELAEDTYRFGFVPITVGHMVAEELHSRFGMQPRVAPFGCDTATYRVLGTAPRDGVVFYAKPGVARRGYELGILALERFHRTHPDVRIHTFGMKARNLPFRAIVHSHLEPATLNELYNTCWTGLALSFTNISLIANELLSAGVVPVVNDYAGTRADLCNPHVQWARSTPDAIADALVAGIERQKAAGAAALHESVRSLSWEPAKQIVVAAIEEACA